MLVRLSGFDSFSKLINYSLHKIEGLRSLWSILFREGFILYSVIFLTGTSIDTTEKEILWIVTEFTKYVMSVRP